MVYFGSQFKVTVICGGEDTVAGALGSWSHCVCSQEAKKKKKINDGPTHFQGKNSHLSHNLLTMPSYAPPELCSCSDSNIGQANNED